MSLDELTSWLPGSRANPSAMRVNAVARLMLDGYGRTYTESFNAHGQLGFFLRTFLDCSRWDLLPFSMTWEVRRAIPKFPTSPSMKRGHLYFLLTRSGRRTRGNGCSSSDTGLTQTTMEMWPTPVTGNGKDQCSFRPDGSPYPGRVASPQLTDAVRMIGNHWPTPDARDSQPGGMAAELRRLERYSTIGLEAAAKLWATPSASDGMGGRVHGGEMTPTGIRPDGSKVQVSLNEQVTRMWPTPRADGFDAGGHPGAVDSLHQAAKLAEANPTDDPTMWPTPRVAVNRASRAAMTRDGHWSAPGLEQAVELSEGILPPEFDTVDELNSTARRLWPTPQTRDYRSPDAPDSPRAIRKREQGWSTDLNDAAAMWQTPMTSDANGVREYDGKRGVGLNTQAAQWSTPTAQDGKNGSLPPSQVDRDTLPGDMIRDGSSGKLNPAWVSQLMGFPDGWLDIPDGPPVRANPNTRGKRRAPSRPVTRRRTGQPS